jgi:methyl-accepting chemotaxis protein
MSISGRSLSLGVMAGLFAGGLTLALVLTVGPLPGAVAGLLPAALAGAVAAAVADRAARTTIAAALAGIELPERPGGDGTHAPPGPTAFEHRLARLREELERSTQLERDFARAERAARSFLAPALLRGELSAAELGSRLPAVLDRLRQAATAIHRDASSLGELNERVASGATDQSDAVSRTASAVEALSEKIDRIALNADEAAKACEQVRDEARRGLDQVHTVIEGMDRLLAQIEASGRKTRRLEDRSGEIGVIVETIRGISGRTDMLALNATIESVRAGEHGRGFAVVAEEIRKLSERTSTATREIGTIVEAIQVDTHESITALGQSQAEMHRESERIRETGSALEHISQAAERSARLVEGISKSTNDQVVATQDLVRAMQRISEVTHQTLDRTNHSRTSLKALVLACEPWQQLASATPPAEPPPSREPQPGSSLNPLARRKRELTAAENAR